MYIKRFHQILVGFNFQSFQNMLLVAECGKKNNWNMASFHLFFQYLAHSFAIHYWHHDIRQN